VNGTNALQGRALAPQHTHRETCGEEAQRDSYGPEHKVALCEGDATETKDADRSTECLDGERATQPASFAMITHSARMP
jgi:hypothetical protein